MDMVTAMVKIIQGHKYSPKKINFILLNLDYKFYIQNNKDNNNSDKILFVTLCTCIST